MKVQVTKEHIQNGTPNNSFCCPIALAVNERIENTDSVSVGATFITVGDGWADLPEKALEFIHAFDSGRPVSPFEFEIRTHL